MMKKYLLPVFIFLCYHVENESVIENKENFSDYNLFVSKDNKELAKWMLKGWDRGSMQIPLKADFNKNEVEITLQSMEVFPLLNLDVPIETDIFEKPRNNQVAGPFANQFKGEITLKLK